MPGPAVAGCMSMKKHRQAHRRFDVIPQTVRIPTPSGMARICLHGHRVGQAPRAMVQTQPGHFIFTVATNSFAELTAAYPGGDFTFDVLNSSTTISLPDGTSLPNPPTLSNYDADQSIDPTKDFNLAWIPSSGGTSKDSITVTITDSSSATVFQTASSGCPSSLDGTASSVLIPANRNTIRSTYLGGKIW
jgi:hypothetical protein